jgi:hypothetical protein
VLLQDGITLLVEVQGELDGGPESQKALRLDPDDGELTLRDNPGAVEIEMTGVPRKKRMYDRLLE